MKKKTQKEYNFSDMFFAGVALLKEKEHFFHQFARSGLLLAKTGIDFLLLRLGEETKKTTKVRKIKIE